MSWQDDYLEKYKKLKEQGKSFFPHAVFKDTVMAFIIMAALLYLAVHFGAELQDPADPIDSNYNPRPEWYFLFLFQALTMFPGNLESIAAVFLPAAGVSFLFLLPFLDRGPERHPFNRPFFSILGLTAIAAIGYLTYLGAVSPLTNPIVENDPVVMAGRKLYVDLNCAYCHSIGGKGGRVGPALDMVVEGETAEWLEKHFRDPKSVNPSSTMPKLNLLDDEIKALVAYMLTLGGASFTAEAPKLFTDNCAVCHKYGSEGGEVGPDLSLIATARDKNYIKRYTKEPSKLNPASSMPGFNEQLTDTQIEDIARYLTQKK